MTVWLDAHLSPAIAPWLETTFGVKSVPVRDLGLREAQDPPIFAAAKAAGVVVMTKDADFAEMVERLGPPPQVLWLRCGNARIRLLLISAPSLEPAAFSPRPLSGRNAQRGKHGGVPIDFGEPAT